MTSNYYLQDTLLSVCAFQDDAAAFDAVQGTILCEKLVMFLKSSFQTLLQCSEELDVGQVEEMKVNWLEAHHLLKSPSTTPVSISESESDDGFKENCSRKVFLLKMNYKAYTFHL